MLGTRLAAMVAEFEEEVEETREQQELAGRVLRKLMLETLGEAKACRAEVSAMGERIVHIEQAVDRVALTVEDQLIELRERLRRIESAAVLRGEPTSDEVCAPFDPGQALKP